MNILVGKYDVDISIADRARLRNEFSFQRSAIADDSENNGYFVGIDNTSAEKHSQGIQPEQAFLVMVTQALMNEIKMDCERNIQ